MLPERKKDMQPSCFLIVHVMQEEVATLLPLSI